MDDADRTDDAPEVREGMAPTVVRSTILFALAHGLTADQIASETGLPRDAWMDRDRRLPNEVVPAVWRLLYARCPGRPLSLEMAAAAPFEFFGSVGYAVQFARSLREGLTTFIRYRGLLSDQLDTRLVDEGDVTAMISSHPTNELDGGAGAEVGLGVALRFFREVLGVPDALRAVRFGHAPLCDPALYAPHLSLPFSFGHEGTGLVLSTAALDRPLPRASTEVFAYITSHLQLAAERLAVPDGLADVRAAIAEGGSRGEYGAEALAARLGVSLRVLQRRVAEHGATVRELIGAAREENAKALLGDDRLSVEEVGFLLGYSEERAFRRAFKRMTGSSPAAWRREQEA